MNNPVRKYNHRLNKLKIKLKINHFPVHISLDIMIPAVVFALIGEIKIFIIALTFSLAHESAHFAMAKILKYRPERISVNMFGEVMHMNEEDISPEHEILIHISGPVFNLITALIFLILYRNGIEPPLNEDIMIINIVLGIFNLLPFYPLDGGKIIFIYLKYFMEEKTAKKLLFTFAKVFLIFNFFLGLYLVQYNLLNLLICPLAVNIFAAIKREEMSDLFKGVLKAKKEQENKNYV